MRLVKNPPNQTALYLQDKYPYITQFNPNAVWVDEKSIQIVKHLIIAGAYKKITMLPTGTRLS